MSTPTSTPRPPNHKPPYPSALTPSASATSPAAPALNAGNIRSVPSPANIRSPANMRSDPSPANVRSVPSPAYLSSLSSKTIRSPQTMRSPQMTRSPHANSTPRTANAKSPLHGVQAPQNAGAASTPRAGAGVNSPAAAMLGMGPFVAATGMTPAGMAADAGGSADGGGGGVLGLSVRDQEDERRRRTEEIVKIVGARWGRVSQEGVERCARRVGLECLWEEGQGQTRTLSMAGQGVLIDVEFTGEEIGAVVLSFPASGEGVGKRGVEGAEVLRSDLRRQEKGYTTLDAFVKNLKRLSEMDQLSEGGVNCFDAVEGLYDCLQRIHRSELNRWGAEQSEDAEGKDLETEIMCSGNGRPKMHTRGTVGLSLQYWAERRLVRRKRKVVDEMDIDSGMDSKEREEPSVCSALIECEASPSSLYPPLRVSSDWISTSIEKPTSNDPALYPFAAGSSIDWQEPPPTLRSENPDPNPLNINSAPLPSKKSPHTRFVARLQPPVVVPLQVAIDIYESVDAPLAQESIEATTYESLLFADVDALTPSPSQTPHCRVVEQTVTSYDSAGTTTRCQHKYTLFVPAQSFARRVENIPFSHPRQLIAILPILRQWVLLGSILRRSFTPQPFSPPTNGEIPQPTSSTETLTVEEELAAFLAPSPSPLASALPVDIVLNLAPSLPRIRTIFELGGTLRSVVVGVGLNGVVVEGENEEQEATRENGIGKAFGGLNLEEREKVRKVLALSESLGVLVSWMKLRVDGKGGGLG